MTDINKEGTQKFSILNSPGRVVLLIFLGFSVFLIISSLMLVVLTKQSGDVAVPAVTGKKFVDVYNSLVRSGIRPKVRFRDVYDMDEGLILSQYPESGRIVDEESILTLVVSRSALRLDVPNLVGVELPIAVNKLKNLHFHGRSVSLGVGVISYIPSERSSENIIIDQSPVAGEKVGPDKKINLLVSSGSAEMDRIMPGVAGQSIDLCYDLLAAKGLTVLQEIVETWNRDLSGKVVSHVPYKGAFIKKGAVARVRVYWYPLKEHPYSAYEKVAFLIPEGQKNGLYEAIIEDNWSKRIRFSRVMSPGQKIEFVFHRRGNAKITITCDKKQVRIMGIDVEEFK